MPTLTKLRADASVAMILEHIARDGAVIVERYLPAASVERLRDELDPFIRQTAPFADDFSGHQTTRTGGLIARSSTVRRLLLDALVHGAALEFLKPHTDKVQLNLTQVIRLLPGQGAQVLHRDRFIWGKYLPREVEPMLNTIWALTDFTAENGATRVVPGSHRWDWERVAADHEVMQAVMPKGSVMFYTGSVIHSGGENRTEGERVALNLTYCNGWLRQEENQYLSCPPEVAAQFAPELRALLGYTMGNFALGYYSPLPADFVAGSPGTLPPEMAFAEEPTFDLSNADVPKVATF